MKLQDIESELYSLVHTVKNLYQKFQNGNVNEFFFRKSIKGVMNTLLNLNLTIKKNNLMLSTLLDNMDFAPQYHDAIDIINKISMITSTQRSIHQKHARQADSVPSKSVLELPQLTSEITSSFITLMDALKLGIISDEDLIFDLFDQLKEDLLNFPGLNEIHLKLEKIERHCRRNASIMIRNKQYRDRVVEHLYKIYKEFQDLLKLHT